jgi:cytoskeletal protein CcmA (bactofilin family)
MLSSRVGGANWADPHKTNIEPPLVKQPPAEPSASSSLARDNRQTDEDAVVFIGKSAVIRGDVVSTSIVEVRGSLEGNVTTQSMIVRDGGSFRGDLKAHQAEIHGTVDGKIEIDDLLDIRQSGRVSAEARYGRLSVSTGGSLSGNVKAQHVEVDELKVPLFKAHEPHSV